MYKMGINFDRRLCKRKNRWIFLVEGVIGDPDGNAAAVSILPPSRAHRPNMSFKTMEAKHLNEDIFYPAKPDWKPINLTLYDIVTNESQSPGINGSGIFSHIKKHPIMDWIREIYDPQYGTWTASTNGFIKSASVILLDGCGSELERWNFENAWLESADFGELDYQGSEVITCDITLRYARAYIPTNYSIVNLP